MNDEEYWFKIMIGILRTALLTTLLLILSANNNHVSAADHLSYEEGAFGDDASRRNLGVQAEIRTHSYSIEAPESPSPRDDAFWVGSNLDNGAFVRFGYFLTKGNACLSAMRISGISTCLGRIEFIENSDARWFFQYKPNLKGDDHYTEIGPAMSVGLNGTWHRYSISPSTTQGWSFRLDGVEVGVADFRPTQSESQAYMIAEQVSMVPLTRLGPAEFKNLSYLKNDGWHSVESLRAIRSCAVGARCTGENPYGVAVLGPNHIIAGSGVPERAEGELIWESLASVAIGILSQLSGIAPILVPVLLLIFVVASAILLRRHAKKMMD